MKAAVRRWRVIAVALACLAGAGTALACQCGKRDLATRVREADAVLLVQVTEVRLVEGESRYVEARFKVIETIKKGSREFAVVRDETCGIGNCSNCLTPGIDYLFIVPRSDTPFVGMCTGSVPVNTRARTFPRLLEELKGYARER